MIPLPSTCLTNTITNSLHALFLLSYVIMSLYFYLKKIHNFQSIKLVLLFFSFFLLKCLGAYAHYAASPDYSLIWISIGIGAAISNYLFIYSIDLPQKIRWLLLFMILFFTGFFLHKIISSNQVFFIYISASVFFVYSIAAYYSKNRVRIALVCIVLSNLSWVIMRESLVYFYDFIPDACPLYAYDNDIYHLMLIFSTFLLFRAIYMGDWPYPKKN